MFCPGLRRIIPDGQCTAGFSAEWFCRLCLNFSEGDGILQPMCDTLYTEYKEEVEGLFYLPVCPFQGHSVR